ncbi:MAG: nucleoside triphosphate pyrophosphohydrolase [Armatimonadetes bacterium]|nr:nucleoside triphosphate pyrophosphohydrolase [Armatimonadota bacterium]
MEELRRLGLQGPFQVHLAPTVLVPDERAHQVFRGFGKGLGSVVHGLGSRYPFMTPATVLRGNGRADRMLSELAELEWAEEDVLVIPAMRSDHSGGLYGLVWVVDRLLGPGGCPWDQEQTHASLKRHLIEEAYELIDAIDAGSDTKMREELGDVLLQPVMHAQMESLAGNWSIDEVARIVTDKLVRRHPHVFGDLEVSDAEEVLRNWDAIKANEGGEPKSVLEGVPRSLPALLRAFEVSKRAARNGFEWPDLEGVWEKLEEEKAELKEAVATGSGISDEIGDLLFTVVNLARWLKIEPEDALRAMVDRFTARFQTMERLSEGPLGELTPDQWEELWQQAKAVS